MLKDQIALIVEELNECEDISEERVSILIEKTKSIAKDLDKENNLRGLLSSRVDLMYTSKETKYPKRRLKKVLRFLIRKSGVEIELK